MKVILANHFGMCFGVRDAIVAARNHGRPETVTILGEIVHNQQVQSEMKARGFGVTPEGNRKHLPPTPEVMITAHGASDRRRDWLAAAGKTVVDTTCPLVERVHDAAKELQEAGYFVVVIGRRGHVEVQGVVEDLRDYAIVQSEDDVREYGCERIGIVCQSTTPPGDLEAMERAIREANSASEVRVIDTICQPTRERQHAVKELLPQVEALIVVGGSNSNNTRRLGALAEAHGVPWVRVGSSSDLNEEWLSEFAVVGLTAGTSTPDTTVREVHEALLEIA